MNFITRYSHIQNERVYLQGSEIFASATGQLDNFLEAAFNHLGLNYPKFYKMDRLSKLGLLASEVILKDIPLHARYQTGQVAIVLSNAYSSLDTDVRFRESMKTIASPALFVYTLPNIVAGEICIRHGIRGENAFFISPEFDAGLMFDYVSMLMDSEKTQACIAGWIEVMGDHHDVFLYLIEKLKGEAGLEHSISHLQKIYSQNHGTIDGESEKADH
jgi:hypothetical protein